MPVTHTNRQGQLYYLHVGATKSGKLRYWFSMKADGDLVDPIPEGFEVYENPNNQVFLRKRKPQVVTPEEVAIVENGLKRFAPGENCIVDLRDEHIVVYHSDRIEFDSEILGRLFPFSAPPVRYYHYTAVMGSRSPTGRRGRSASSVGASGARSTAGSTSRWRGTAATSRAWSGNSPRTSARSRSSS